MPKREKSKITQMVHAFVCIATVLIHTTLHQIVFQVYQPLRLDVLLVLIFMSVLAISGKGGYTTAIICSTLAGFQIGNVFAYRQVEAAILAGYTGADSLDPWTYFDSRFPFIGAAVGLTLAAALQFGDRTISRSTATHG